MDKAGPSISVIIPTQRRLGGLEVAVRSTFQQSGVDLSGLELIVVDNDQVPSARDLVEKLKGQAPFAITYAHEPSPGVANARNAAMAAAHGEWIAFLDDDEEAPPTWLSALLAVQAQFDADVVFGPVRGRAPEATGPHKAYFEWFFSRFGPDKAQVLDIYYGCGDSLIRRAALPHPIAPFATSRNHIGGEDDLLFGQMKAAGAQFAWAPEAWVWEDPLPERLTLAYTFSRGFAYGQGPTQAAHAEGDWLGVIRWMIIGLGQGGLNLLLAGTMALFGSKRTVFQLDYAIRCFGKTFWWGPFQKTFYGLTAKAAA